MCRSWCGFLAASFRLYLLVCKSEGFLFLHSDIVVHVCVFVLLFSPTLIVASLLIRCDFVDILPGG